MIAGQDVIAEGGHGRCRVLRLAIGVGLHRERYRKVSGDVVFAEGCFVAVFFRVPGEDADLVEVVGQAGFIGGEDCEVLRDAGYGLTVVDHAGVGVVYVGEDVGAYDALAFGVAGQGVGGVYVDQVGVDPACVAIGVADEPPVFHGRFGWSGGRVFISGSGGDSSAGSYWLRDHSALQELQLVAFLEAEEEGRLASGGDVEQGFVPHGCISDGGVLQMACAEIFKLSCCFLVCGLFFANPADFAVGRTDLHPALGAFHDDQFVAILYFAGAVGDGRDAIDQESLLGGDVDVLVRWFGVQMGTTAQCHATQQGRGDVDAPQPMLTCPLQNLQVHPLGDAVRGLRVVSWARSSSIQEYRLPLADE